MVTYNITNARENLYSIAEDVLDNNLVTITDEYYGLQRDRFLIQSISYTLGDQCEMTLTCSNIANFSELNIGL